MSILEEIEKTTIAGDQIKVAELTEQALEQGIDPDDIIQNGLIPAMGVVGKEFSEGVRYIPEMLLAARAMQTAMEVIKPHLKGGEVKTMARAVLGTVQGDLHDIGKNLVRMMLEGSGVEVIDLGVDVSPGQIVEAVKTHQPQFVGLSALLTTTMSTMIETIEALEEAGLRKQVKVLVGGAPVTQEFADEIGADGYGVDATQAVDRIKELVA
jgi:5-methyltetrahydrofolate--homocysteine methyltransferase